MINELIKYKLALMFIAFLVGLKFLFIPLYNWQTERFVSLELKSKQLDKTTALVTMEKEFDGIEQAITKEATQQDLLFFYGSSSEQLKLDLYALIEQKVAAHKLQINNFVWVNERVLEGFSAVELRVSFSIKGRNADLASFLIELESEGKLVLVNELSLVFNSRNNQLAGLGYVDNGSVILSFIVKNERK